MLQVHRDVGQTLYVSLIQNRIRSLIRKIEPSLLEGEGPTDFKVSLAWTRDFFRRDLNWSYRVVSGAARNNLLSI